MSGCPKGDHVSPECIGLVIPRVRSATAEGGRSGPGQQGSDDEADPAVVNTSTAERGLSGTGVLDKASLLLDAVGAGPASLAEPAASTGPERPAVHRLTRALERLRLLDRDTRGRFVLGPRLGAPAVTAWQGRLTARAASVLARAQDVDEAGPGTISLSAPVSDAGNDVTAALSRPAPGDEGVRTPVPRPECAPTVAGTHE
ncbi:helix-turn-helix domain-containing protein [Streptomyces sp. NPDC057236]|uniref:helix-turn-helix domain-containing protein n=1 Tax=Streptomyces sp. NPDC057236 TaxID=3346059 RepID=UPI00363096F9